MSGDDLKEEAEACAAAHGLELADLLGWGIHGSVWNLKTKEGTFASVLKIHRREASYIRERDCYQRLLEMRVELINGVAVPILVRVDERWLAVQMTLVERPFLLGFGTVWLDERPEFPSEVLEEGLLAARKKFGEDWPVACEILRVMEVNYGVIIKYLCPGNLVLR